ncbi:MAG: LysR family transcriptional regulator [Succinivibrio sp.]
MDLRVLKYFVTVAHEQCITTAAEKLKVTQPTLSRQLKDLESEFGAQLFIRGSRSRCITLTPKGLILKRRAEELLALAEKTCQELSADAEVSGTVYMGLAETQAVRAIGNACRILREKHPKVDFNFYSADSCEVREGLEKGVLDFGLFCVETDLREYETLEMPFRNYWGAYVRSDSPLSQRKSLGPSDFKGVPVLVSGQLSSRDTIAQWFGAQWEGLDIAASFNLIYNSAEMAKEGLGAVIGFNGLVNTQGTGLVFVPLEPELKVTNRLAWRRNTALSQPAEEFLDVLRSSLAGSEE